MAVSIAGVFLASARPGELAYRHTRTSEIARRHAQSSPRTGLVTDRNLHGDFVKPRREALYGKASIEAE